MSTPEILERVYTIESEILQIEEAIAIQGNNDIMVSLMTIYTFNYIIFRNYLFLIQAFIIADRRPTCKASSNVSQ